MADLQYPIGKFVEDPNPTPEKRREKIAEIQATADWFRKAVAGLNETQLDTPYRDGGWTVRQVVHHMADSHVHNLIRFRMALTQDSPAVPGYDPAKWAEIPDAKSGPIEVSLNLLAAIHDRWALLLKAMSAADFSRTFRRPDGQTITLDRALQTYAWHGKHHAAHITGLRERMGWR